MQLRVSAAHSSSEARFQSERHTSAVSLLDATRAEVAEERSRKAEIQSMLMSVQKALVDRDAALAAAHDDISRLNASLSSLRAEKQILESSEARLSKEVASLTQDRDRQLRLVDSLRALEEGLKSHESEQRKRLQVCVTEGRDRRKERTSRRKE